MDGTGQHYSAEVQFCCCREPKEVVRGHANYGADRGAEDDAGVRCGKVWVRCGKVWVRCGLGVGEVWAGVGEVWAGVGEVWAGCG